MIELSDISRVDEDAMSLVVRCECGVVNKFEFEVPMGTSGNPEIIKPIESEQKSNDLHEDVKKMIVEDSETRTELEKISFRLERLEKDVSELKNAAGLWLADNKTELTKDDIKTIKQMSKLYARYGIITPEPKEPDCHDAVFNPENRDAGASVVNLKGLFDEKVELDLTPKEFDECICGLAYNYSLHPDRTATEEDTKRMFSVMVEKAHMRREQSKEPEKKEENTLSTMKKYLDEYKKGNISAWGFSKMVFGTNEKKEVIRKCCKHTDCLRDLKDIVRGAQICRLIDDDCGYLVEETV